MSSFPSWSFLPLSQLFLQLCHLLRGSFHFSQLSLKLYYLFRASFRLHSSTVFSPAFLELLPITPPLPTALPPFWSFLPTALLFSYRSARAPTNYPSTLYSSATPPFSHSSTTFLELSEAHHLFSAFLPTAWSPSPAFWPASSLSQAAETRYVSPLPSR